MHLPARSCRLSNPSWLLQLRLPTSSNRCCSAPAAAPAAAAPAAAPAAAAAGAQCCRTAPVYAGRLPSSSRHGQQHAAATSSIASDPKQQQQGCSNNTRAAPSKQTNSTKTHSLPSSPQLWAPPPWRFSVSWLQHAHQNEEQTPGQRLAMSEQQSIAAVGAHGPPAASSCGSAHAAAQLPAKHAAASTCSRRQAARQPAATTATAALQPAAATAAAFSSCHLVRSCRCPCLGVRPLAPPAVLPGLRCAALHAPAAGAVLAVVLALAGAGGATAAAAAASAALAALAAPAHCGSESRAEQWAGVRRMRAGGRAWAAAVLNGSQGGAQQQHARACMSVGAVAGWQPGAPLGAASASKAGASSPPRDTGRGPRPAPRPPAPRPAPRPATSPRPPRPPAEAGRAAGQGGAASGGGGVKLPLLAGWGAAPGAPPIGGIAAPRAD